MKHKHLEDGWEGMKSEVIIIKKHRGRHKAIYDYRIDEWECEKCGKTL